MCLDNNFIFDQDILLFFAPFYSSLITFFLFYQIWCDEEGGGVNLPPVPPHLILQNTPMVPDNIVVSGQELKALVIHLASLDREPGQHVSRVLLLLAHVDIAPGPSHVRMPGLHDVRGVDDHVGVDVGRVDPGPGKVLGQEAFRFHRNLFSRIY